MASTELGYRSAEEWAGEHTIWMERGPKHNNPAMCQLAQRVPSMPVSHSLERRRRAQKLRFDEMAGSQLKSDGWPFMGKASGQGDGWIAGHVERRRETRSYEAYRE
jgi:hypothetical protein